MRDKKALKLLTILVEALGKSQRREEEYSMSLRTSALRNIKLFAATAPDRNGDDKDNEPIGQEAEDV